MSCRTRENAVKLDADGQRRGVPNTDIKKTPRYYKWLPFRPIKSALLFITVLIVYTYIYFSIFLLSILSRLFYTPVLRAYA